MRKSQTVDLSTNYGSKEASILLLGVYRPVIDQATFETYLNDT